MNSHLARASELIEEAIAGLSETDLSWHPEGKWSSAEILEHLARAFHGSAKALERVLAESPATRPITLRDRVSVAVVAGLGYFPPGRKSPAMVEPKGWPPAEAVQRIRESLPQVDAAITACEKKYGSSRKLSNHPVLGPLNAREWRRFHFVHTRHHMRQIRRRREQMKAAATQVASI